MSAPPRSFSLRCTQCNAQQKATRNLVVCIDGTSNKFGQNNTNVVKLLAKIDQQTAQPEQYTYYSSGIGTHPKSLGLLNRMDRALFGMVDMAVAWNVEEIVKDAYRWLAQMYQEGDQIYLFGFSRGAYQVRVLAGMIYEVGLIKTLTENQIGIAYDHYQAIRSGQPKKTGIARQFKNTFSWKDMRVHFIGVWDTVSSVGLLRGDILLSSSSSAAHACHFRHALALDELRVKFMPEYIHEMNSQTDNGKSKYIVTPTEVQHITSPTSVDQRHNSAVRDYWSGLSGTQKNGTGDIKEVWFAGSHSDVGGRNTPGKFHHAGNVSLLWMRREATASGLVLEPTDMVWVPQDIDFGISDSMTRVWRFFEYVPLIHQVSFCGSGQNSLRWHRSQPRRIIPGQKVHASVLYSSMYKPQATLGEGFDVPMLRTALDGEPDDEVWETGLFDNAAAQELVAYLAQQEVPPIYLDRLLFMLRFKEGRKCVRNVPKWQDQFKTLINNPDCAPLVRLITIVIYYEASCDPEEPENSAFLAGALPQNIIDDAKESFRAILAAYKHRDGPRVVALLRPLTNHKILREQILTQDVLGTLVDILDNTIRQELWNFGQAMDGLNCLLNCEHTQKTIIDKLGANHPAYNVSRLSRILYINESHLLLSALRMVVTLSRIPEARWLCSVVKPRLRELASKDEPLVGFLAVQILLAVYDPSDREQLDIHNARIRSNLASALTHLDPNGHDPTDPAQQILRRLFGLGADRLDPIQKKLIGQLKGTVKTGNAWDRTNATMTLLKLCETKIIRTYFLQIMLLDDFVNQLRHKDTALLAAYALTTCLKYSDMKDSMKDNKDLPRNIVGMLLLDYFDDAVGQIEGFKIFGDFMQHVDLREKIEKYNISEILSTKLGKGKSKETRTSLIFLDIFRSFNHNGQWTDQLVGDSLKSLRKSQWKAQKPGVNILSALAQTEHGVATIAPRIHEITEMLLPKSYSPTRSMENGILIPPSEGETQPAAMTTADTYTDSTSDPWMMGPACALRILAQNKVLRDRTRETIQYGSLKHLFLSGTLFLEMGALPSSRRIRTPNLVDIIDMLDKVIQVVVGELTEVMSMDAILSHIEHSHPKRILDHFRWKRKLTIKEQPSLLHLECEGDLRESDKSVDLGNSG